MDFSDGSGSIRSDTTRPVSRRGYREHTNNGSALSRSGSMRPTSAYRGSTASRLTTGFGPAPPTAGRQQTAVTGFSMIDRPITQQGISGLRTGTGRGFRTRQLQDKRYWEELMQVKIREMKAEIARLSEQAEAGEREKSAKKHYEKRVRELAQELTDLQGRLADYNTAIRILNGEATKQSVEEQTRELEATNQKMQDEIEQVFMEKRRKENQLRQIREQIEKEQSTITKILAEMTVEQKDQYNELQTTAAALREEVEQSRTQLDLLNREKEEFAREISGSQIKVHLLELHRRLVAVEEKRDNMRNEINNRLDPQEEREKLLSQVREDNAAIAVLDNNATNLKEQIKKVQELIEQSEQATATRERLATELHTLPEKTRVMKEELVTLSDLEMLREQGEEQKKALEVELQQLREKLAPTESAVTEARNKLKTLQTSLEGNEMYSKLNSLEEEVAQLEARKTVLEEDIASITLKADYEPLKRQALDELAALNKKIIEDLNSVKSY
uniref:Intraflagellar transport protein 74 homolog n=1 Tax=Bombyx mori TaxID=7091 RepID=A0A8R2HQB0_BOMMO|nr:intraflagellar transport protein 74 homolog isoform X3 [Bombyx mori]